MPLLAEFKTWLDNNDSNAGDQNNNSKPEHSGDNDSVHVVEDFTQKPVCSFAVTTGGEIKIDSAAPAVDGPVQIRPAAIPLPTNNLFRQAWHSHHIWKYPL